MLEMFVTPEFAGWFEALVDREAEEVATAIEVVAARPADPLEPAGPHGSTYLLWYEHIPPELASLSSVLDELGHGRWYAHRLLSRMQVPSVGERYSQLSTSDAAREAPRELCLAAAKGRTGERSKLEGSARQALVA